MSHSTINRERLLSTFLELVTVNAPSRRESAMASRVRGLLAAEGLTCEEDGAAAALGGEEGNLVARVPGTASGPTLLFCAHLDTVEPTAELQVQREGGVIRSDGTTILGADDRAGVAAIIEVVRALRESGAPHPLWELLFTVAEEIGVMGAQVMDGSLLTATCGFVPDSTGPVGTIVARGPRQQNLHVTITGKAAHAGMAPEQGISAISVAAKAIARMALGRVDAETTANVGTMHGGMATNIVAEHATIEAEARSRDENKLRAQVAHMTACFAEEAAAVGASADVVVRDVYPAFHIPDDAPPVRLAVAAAEALGITPTVTVTGGGSDANFINGLGIPTVILSAGYEKAHTHEEYIPEAELVKLAEWLYGIAVGATGV